MQKPRKTARAEAPRKATAQNAYTALKSEIARLARKEVRVETDSLKKLSSQYRSDIAELKRQVKALERHIRHVSRATGQARGAEADEEPTRQIRFSAKSIAAQRRRLGLSAHAFGALLGVSGQSIYKWEAGEVRPRASQLQAVASVRLMGRREAQAKLKSLLK